MESNTSFRFLRWLLLAIAVCVGGIQGLAQTKTAPPSKTTAKEQVLKQHPPSKAWIKDPNAVMPMRQMTNAQRRAAAQRNQARRANAEAQRKLRPQPIRGCSNENQNPLSRDAAHRSTVAVGQTTLHDSPDVQRI